MSSFASCSQEAVCTFAWSDFPAVSQNCMDDLEHLANVLATSQLPYKSTPPSFPATSGSCSFVPDYEAPASQAVDDDDNDVDTSSDDDESNDESSSESSVVDLTSYTRSSSTKTSSHKKKVSFSSILEVHSHPIILGEHPCCMGGMALDCDWSYETHLVDMEIHESVSPKRRQGQLRLNYAQRRQRLQKSMGVSGNELVQQEFELMCGGRHSNVYHMLHHTPSVQRALQEAAEMGELSSAWCR